MKAKGRKDVINKKALELYKKIRPEIKNILNETQSKSDYIIKLQCLDIQEMDDLVLMDYLNLMVLDYLKDNTHKAISFVRQVNEIFYELRRRKLK